VKCEMNSRVEITAMNPNAEVESVVGMARCAVPALKRRGIKCTAVAPEPFTPPAERGRGPRSATALPCDGDTYFAA
jgi:hypothetical protein